MNTAPSSADDVRARVLQATLEEMSSRRDEGGPGPGPPDLCCVVCLDGVSDACVARPCAHRNFDFLCLVSWLQRNTACPLCKATVEEVRYGFDDDAGTWKTFRVDPPASGSAAGPSSSSSSLSSSAGQGWEPRSSAGSIISPMTPLARRRRRHHHHPERSSSQLLPVPDEALRRRRHVYAHGLYSLHVGSNRYQRPRWRELTPWQFAADAELVSRARKWIRRELQVFAFLSPDDDTPSGEASQGSSTDANGNGDDSVSARSYQQQQQRARRARRASNAEFLLEYVVAILKTVDTQGSRGQAEDMLQEFLGYDHARLFLHELRSWLRSPYTDLAGWDRNVQYRGAKAGRTPEGEEEGDIGGGEDSRPGKSRRDSARDGPSHWRPGQPRHGPYHHPRRREPSHERSREAVRRYAPD